MFWSSAAPLKSRRGRSQLCQRPSETTRSLVPRLRALVARISARIPVVRNASEATVGKPSVVAEPVAILTGGAIAIVALPALGDGRYRGANKNRDGHRSNGLRKNLVSPRLSAFAGPPSSPPPCGPLGVPWIWVDRPVWRGASAE